MPTLKELRERRGNLEKQAHEIVDRAEKEDRGLNTEEKAAFEKIHKDDCDLRDRIQTQEKLDSLKTELDAKVDPDRRRGNIAPTNASPSPRGKSDPKNRQERLARKQRLDARAIQGWMLYQSGRPLNKAQKAAMREAGIGPRTRELSLRIGDSHTFAESRRQYLNSQSTLGVTTGGALIPQGFVPRLERALLQYGAMLQVAEVMTTETGQDLPWPTVNDTSNMGIEIAQAFPVTEQDVTFGSMVLQAFKYTSKMVQVPVELMEDSAFNLVEILGDMLGERLGRILNTRFTTGNGANQPYGITLGAPAGRTTASATAFTFDDFYTLKHSVDPAYRMGAKWMLHDQVLLAAKLLKDSYGRYLWQASVAGGVPDTIDNDPVVTNQQMANSLEANNIVVVYGDLSKYKCRLVRTVRLRRLVERYADQDLEGFVAFMRADGALLDAGTHPVKVMQMQ